jgi:hypothetical protein
MALEPQPLPGALAGAAAGPAGRAVETPYAATAALSDASGIGPGNPQAAALRGDDIRPNDPAAWGWLCSEVADDGGNLEDHPALASRYAGRKPPFQRANSRQIGPGRR